MPKLFSRALFVCLIIFFSFSSAKAEKLPNLQKWGYEWEEYDSSLFYRLQSIPDLLCYADSALGVEARQSRAYSELLTALIRKRFYHGYSYYSAGDNWLAWLGGIAVWDHLHAIVLPDDIMKHPMAACSQQSIVLKECFKRAGIDYREVALAGHFVLEGRVEEEWLLFDPNLEPQYPRGRKSLNELIHTGELIEAYHHVLSFERLQKMFAAPVYRKVNAPIAPNGTLFQQVTRFLSLVLPLVLPLAALFYLVVKSKKRKEETLEGVKFVVIERKVEQEVEALRC
jgi:hypothetical protein